VSFNLSILLGTSSCPSIVQQACNKIANTHYMRAEHCTFSHPIIYKIIAMFNISMSSLTKIQFKVSNIKKTLVLPVATEND